MSMQPKGQNPLSFEAETIKLLIELKRARLILLQQIHKLEEKINYHQRILLEAQRVKLEARPKAPSPRLFERLRKKTGLSTAQIRRALMILKDEADLKNDD